LITELAKFRKVDSKNGATMSDDDKLTTSFVLKDQNFLLKELKSVDANGISDQIKSILPCILKINAYFCTPFLELKTNKL